MATSSKIVMSLGSIFLASFLGAGSPKAAAASEKARDGAPPVSAPAAQSPQVTVDQALVAKGTAKGGEPLRAGGDYRVDEIERLADGTFAIAFVSLHPTGRFDRLRLTSDHIHVAVKAGQKLRLSAEIMAESGASAEVAQVVLFMPQIEGRVPVWLLSNKAAEPELKATRYLEMHLPQNDFIIM